MGEITRFVRELRAAGLRVGVSEQLDALEAIRHIPLSDRELFKAALSATLVKRQGDHNRFDLLFEIHFAAVPAEQGPDSDDPASGPAGRRGAPGPTTAELDDLVFTVLFGNDRARMPHVADLAVARYARITPGTHLPPSWFVLQTIQALRLPAVLERLMEEARGTADVSALDERLAQDEFLVSIARFRREVVAAVRRRFVAAVGAEDASRAFIEDEESGGMEQLEALIAGSSDARVSDAEIAELRRALSSLARKLASRIVRNQRDRARGRVDVRRTMRASIATDGAPFDLRFKHTRLARPEIVLLVDLSGSVAPYSRFFLELVYAMSSQFRKVRSFAFVADVDEVTDAFGPRRAPAASAEDVVERAARNWAGDVSDYGRAFETFWSGWSDAVHHGTTVIVLGDARTNGRDGSAWVVGEIRRHARRLYWLNPEPRWEWDHGDSIVSDYEPHVDGLFECRDVRHFEGFIQSLS